jgi:hypothetical protein
VVIVVLLWLCELVVSLQVVWSEMQSLNAFVVRKHHLDGRRRVFGASPPVEYVCYRRSRQRLARECLTDGGFELSRTVPVE